MYNETPEAILSLNFGLCVTSLLILKENGRDNGRRCEVRTKNLRNSFQVK